MGLTLLLAAIEKWGYPSWTFALLEREPGFDGLGAAQWRIL
jgi:hypothetical protein